MISQYLKGIWKDRFVLWSLVNKDLQNKYKRSALGIAWSIITPLGLVLIIGGVYTIIFGADPKTFIPSLFAGLNPWLLINMSAEGGTMAFISAEGYLKQTTVNAQIFPIRNMMVGFVNFLYSVLAFFSIYLFLQPQTFGPKMLLVIPGLVMLFVFVLSISNIASVVNLNVRDYQPLQSLILQGIFYATPIIFEPSMLDAKGFSIIYRINPVYYIIEVVRRPMLGKELPTAETYIVAIGLVVILFCLSVHLVMREKRKITFKL